MTPMGGIKWVLICEMVTQIFLVLYKMD
ncbi:Hypothetical protein BAMTRB_050 [Escherichia phage vB_Eco_Bam]|uniref:Uncharacterized protein n=1 Tax=Escherichia phage vB_Eco_Bam TaxID=2898833 RepID=A0A9P0YC88_9CAUD|nr:Hypothetical protein BAMTRB_050 [Escherichia phage vB_Eco_Bam]